MLTGIVVASPVEDYFLLIDGLEEPDRTASQAVTGPLLDALDRAYDIPAEGTGFYALQSCANHSCEPNAHTLKVHFGPLTAALWFTPLMICSMSLHPCFHSKLSGCVASHPFVHNRVYIL